MSSAGSNECRRTNAATAARVVLVALAAWAAPGAPSAAGGEREAMIGFRRDGSGVFPDDCKPPTDFDGVKGTNLVWKVALPNHSNSSPIVVGRKVFVVCAAGWPEGQDCAALLCFDADTGRQLWKRDLDEFATFPPDRAGEAREVRKEYWRRIRRLNTLLFAYQTAEAAGKAAILKEAAAMGVAAEKSFERNGWGTGSAERAVFNDRSFADKLRKVCAYDPITWSPLCLDVNMPTPVSDGRRIYVYTGRRTVHAFDLDGNLLWQVWQSDAPYNYHWVTDCANSPVIADGLLLMYCFDHLWAYQTATGQLRYATKSGMPHRHGMGSPVLLDLPVAGGGGRTERAIYLWTGDLVRARDGKVLCKSVAPLDCAALGGDGADRVFLGVHGRSSGQAPTGAEPRNWLFPGRDQGGTLAVRFTLAGDTAAAKELWFVAKNDGYKQLGAYPIFRDGLLWLDSGHVAETLTGQAVSAPRSRVNMAYNGSIAAGGCLYGIPESGVNRGSGGAGGLGTRRDVTLVCTVARMGDRRIEDVHLCPIELLPSAITDPAGRARAIAMTGRDRHHEWYGWHGAYSAPFASGNRLFIRTFNALYCFGDKGRPFAPSRAFEAARR